jgi:sensor histidine kinase YesM
MLLGVLMLWFNNSNSMQAVPALVARVYFDGEYRIAEGEWQKIVEGGHIPSTKGDVTLRGNLHMMTPDGEYVGVYRGDIPVALYTDHISLTIFEGEGEPYVIDAENPLYGDSSCGESWTAHYFTSQEDEIIEIRIHNPHKLGNENAIDDMLSGIALWTGIDFEKSVLESGEAQRDIGLFFVIGSLMILGIALFSTLIHIKNTKVVWTLGAVILFAGAYLAYSADGIYFWSESIVSNTAILGMSMMLYMFFFVITIVYHLKAWRSIGIVAATLLGVANAVFFVLPVVTDMLFYDTWIWWIVVQFIANLVLMVCLIKEFINSKTSIKWLYIVAELPLIAFAADVFGTWSGAWKGGVISQYTFIILFVVAIITVLKLIPGNINAATKAKELEVEKRVLRAELAESRVSTMMSQIRPHFIYNTLGSIEQLCEIDPKKAGELVHDFAKYLRGNFGELDNPKPILMSKEMDHVHHYVSIETVRFPDMTFSFEMNSEDFRIPALTIQPIVENAIKHGLMKLHDGGKIRVVSYETDEHYCVSVEDDGVGFDTGVLIDDRSHVGLRNIRERLETMVNGTLEIESTVGVGTTVLIKIPKETKK